MSNSAGQGAPVPETEALLQRIAGMIAGARALPLSSSVKLDNKDEILELLREATDRLPEELRQARWMIKEREEFLAGTERRADELVEAGRSEAQRLVQRTEILKEAQAQARRTLEEARQESQRLRLEAEDYADQKLAQFEIVLERTLKTVASGRQKLSGLPDREDDSLGGGASGGIDTMPGRARTIPAPSDLSRRLARPGAQVGGHNAGWGPAGTGDPGSGPASGEVPLQEENLFDQDRLGQ
jgi:hypothetical protein